MKLTRKVLKVAGKHAGIAAGIIVSLMIVGCLGLSWICTCGIIYLICACFGWTFTWLIATGVWLVTFIARSIFSNTITIKK